MLKHCDPTPEHQLERRHGRRWGSGPCVMGDNATSCSSSKVLFWNPDPNIQWRKIYRPSEWSLRAVPYLYPTNNDTR